MDVTRLEQDAPLILQRTCLHLYVLNDATINMGKVMGNIC